MDKTTIEQLLSSYNWWMGISTVAVAIGILGEYLAHFIFEEEARKNKLEMSISILFGAMVLGGVVGEYIFGEKLSQVATQLQQIADTEVALANKNAATAVEAANKFESQIADANRRAKEAEERTEKLRASIEPRTLSIEQQKALADAVKPLAGRKVKLLSYAGDAEGARLGGMIKAALKGLFIEDRRAGTMIVNGSPPEGVQISGEADFVNAIAPLLTAFHIANTTASGPRGTDNFVTVGVKPFAVLP